MDIKATAIVLALVVVACNGCEMHERMMRERQAALKRAENRRQAELKRAQDRAYENVRLSLYGDSVYTRSTRRYCGQSRTYFCSDGATCIRSAGGGWLCQQPSSTRYRPSVSQTQVGGVSQGRGVSVSPTYTQRTRYYPRTNYGTIRRTYSRTTCSFGLKKVNTTGGNFKCVDIDECATEVSGCNHTCKNTYRSYYCTCRTGFNRVGKTECVDRDECREFSRVCPSTATCLNTDGSYECECTAGYRKSEYYAKRCLDIDECATGEHQCVHNCRNTRGSYLCTCNPGYRLHDSTDCRDINECEEDQNACPIIAACVNTAGSYECICNTGYRYTGVNGPCADVNECAEGNPCEESEICFNTYGSYQCDEPVECPEGYRRANSSKETCNREAQLSDDPNAYDYITYKKIGVPEKERADYTNPLASLAFSGGNGNYEDNFNVRVLEGGEYFWNARRRRQYYGKTLQLEIFNRRALEAGVTRPYTLLITNTMIANFRTYNRYGYSSRPRITTKRKVVMEIVPMAYGEDFDDDDYYY